MSRSEYARAISAVLKPAGFTRVAGRSEWLRKIGEFVDEVDLQGARGAPKVTVNFALRHEGARRTVVTVAGPGTSGTDYPISGRLGQFLGGRDRWWESDAPAGPSEVAELLSSALLPYFEEMHALEAYVDALKRQYLGGHWPYVTPILELAVLLHESGDAAQARHILENPSSRLDPREAPRIAAVSRLLFGDA